MSRTGPWIPRCSRPRVCSRYELLLAIAPEHFAACRAAAGSEGAPLTAIGEFVAESRGLLLRDLAGRETALDTRGFDHFR